MGIEAIQGINPFQRPVDAIGAAQGRSTQAAGGNFGKQPEGNLYATLQGMGNGELTPNADKPGLRTLGFA